MGYFTTGDRLREQPISTRAHRFELHVLLFRFTDRFNS
jgi:hypothetical protein